MGIIIKLIKGVNPCKDCLASYYVTMTGEDGKKYQVPVKIRFCPICGRRIA